MAKVSVIIPIYNVEKYITQALDSVVNQTLADIEIICVNDCTPDKSFEITKEYASKDKRFILLELETNQGQGVARNKALEIAKGDYIMFLDPDDWYELDVCEKAYNQISKNKNEMVFFNLYKHNEIKNTTKISKVLEYLKPFLNENHIDLKTLDLDWFRTCWSVRAIYSSRFLKENNIKYANLRINEDVPFFTKAICDSKDISILDEPLYNYRVKKEKPTTDYMSYFDDVITSRKRAFEYVKNTKSKNLEKAYLAYQIRTIMKWYKKFANSEFCNKNFEAMREYFLFLNEEYNISEISDRINFVGFNNVLDSNSLDEFKVLEREDEEYK